MGEAMLVAKNQYEKMLRLAVTTHGVGGLFT